MKQVSRLTFLLAGLLPIAFFSSLSCKKAECGPAPEIDGALAYACAEKNVSFGVRPASSDALKQSGDWILETLRRMPGPYQVETDEFDSVTPMGRKQFRNIIVSWPGPDERFVILAAHYDTKHFFSGANFVGANDGASGVGILLAVQKILVQCDSLPIGIRMVFFDGEECFLQYGEKDGLYGSRHLAEKWAQSGELARCAGMVLLDMAGDRELFLAIPRNCDARLRSYAFEEAERMGYSAHIGSDSREMLDDFIPFREKGVPVLDLIDFSYGPSNSFWHTEQDTMDKLSPESLKISGDLALAVIWRIAQE